MICFACSFVLQEPEIFQRKASMMFIIILMKSKSSQRSKESGGKAASLNTTTAYVFLPLSPPSSLLPPPLPLHPSLVPFLLDLSHVIHFAADYWRWKMPISPPWQTHPDHRLPGTFLFANSNTLITIQRAHKRTLALVTCMLLFVCVFFLSLRWIIERP